MFYGSKMGLAVPIGFFILQHVCVILAEDSSAAKSDMSASRAELKDKDSTSSDGNEIIFSTAAPTVSKNNDILSKETIQKEAEPEEPEREKNISFPGKVLSQSLVIKIERTGSSDTSVTTAAPAVTKNNEILSKDNLQREAEPEEPDRAKTISFPSKVVSQSLVKEIERDGSSETVDFNVGGNLRKTKSHSTSEGFSVSSSKMPNKLSENNSADGHESTAANMGGVRITQLFEPRNVISEVLPESQASIGAKSIESSPIRKTSRSFIKAGVTTVVTENILENEQKIQYDDAFQHTGVVNVTAQHRNKKSDKPLKLVNYLEQNLRSESSVADQETSVKTFLAPEMESFHRYNTDDVAIVKTEVSAKSEQKKSSAKFSRLSTKVTEKHGEKFSPKTTKLSLLKTKISKTFMPLEKRLLMTVDFENSDQVKAGETIQESKQVLSGVEKVQSQEQVTQMNSSFHAESDPDDDDDEEEEYYEEGIPISFGRAQQTPHSECSKGCPVTYGVAASAFVSGVILPIILFGLHQFLKKHRCGTRASYRLHELKESRTFRVPFPKVATARRL